MTAPIILGDITILRVIEQQAAFFHALEFFPTLSRELLEENRAWLAPKFLDPDSKVILCVQSYIVKTPRHTILVDTCVGNHKPRPTRPFWHMRTSDLYDKNFAATGLSPADIDFVMCTHLHADHVGWNTKLDNGRWVPTFPKAKYVFADRELAHWTQKHKEDPAAHPWVTDSVLPIVEARRTEIVKSSHAFDDQVRLIPTPGHTIDHFSVEVGKRGMDAIIAGDMIHSPLQARYPELGMRADHDSNQAGETRRALFGRICDTPTLLCTAHFPAPSIGRIARWGEGFKVVES